MLIYAEFGRHLAPFCLPFGSLLVPFRSLLHPFGSLNKHPRIFLFSGNPFRKKPKNAKGRPIEDTPSFAPHPSKGPERNLCLWQLRLIDVELGPGSHKAEICVNPDTRKLQDESRILETVAWKVDGTQRVQLKVHYTLYAYAHAADPENSLRQSSLRQPNFETPFCRSY